MCRVLKTRCTGNLPHGKIAVAQQISGFCNNSAGNQQGGSFAGYYHQHVFSRKDAG